MRLSRPVAALPLAFVLACASAPKAPATPPEPQPTLHDRAWTLVAIQSMDGGRLVPSDPARYTLRLDPSGKAQVQADCNRASGGYVVEGQGISFSAFAATRAACAPGSISDAFLQQLGFVRSYVIRDRKLYLATLVDGSILEFR